MEDEEGAEPIIGVKGFSDLNFAKRKEAIEDAFTLQQRYHKEIEAACKEHALSPFLTRFLTKRINEKENGSAITYGFIPAEAIPHKEAVVQDICAVAKTVTEGGAEDSTPHNFEKALRIVCRSNLDATAKVPLFPKIHIHNRKKTAPQHYSAVKTKWRKVLKTMQRQKGATDVKHRKALINLLQELFKINQTEAGDIADDFTETMMEAENLYREIMKRSLDLQVWLHRKTNNSKISKKTHLESRDELGHGTYFDLLFAMFEQELSESTKNGSTKQIREEDHYMAQTLAYLTYLLVWLKRDPTYQMATDKACTQALNRYADRTFWAGLGNQEVTKTLYHSNDYSEVSATPIQSGMAEERSVRVIDLEHANLTNNHCKLTEKENGIVRERAEPKDIIATLFKILDGQENIETIVDLHREQGVMTGISSQDLDSASANSGHTQELHTFMEDLVRKYALDHKLTENNDPALPYSQLPAGTFRVVNKAKWDSSQPRPKGMLAVKVYMAIPVNSRGELHTGKGKPHAVIRKEFRLVPYDQAIKGAKQEDSTFYHKWFKDRLAAKLLRSITAKGAQPEMHKTILEMDRLFEDLDKQERAPKSSPASQAEE